MTERERETADDGRTAQGATERETPARRADESRTEGATDDAANVEGVQGAQGGTVEGS